MSEGTVMTTRKPTVNREKSAPERPSVAVIGSGFGGLAAAIRLQAQGVQVTLYEARDKPGGRAYVYEEDGFIFDAGPTVITAPHCLEELFEVAGRVFSDYVTLLPVEPFYRLQWDDGDSLDYTGDLDAMLAQIRERSPADADGYLRFLEYSRKVFAKGYEELVDEPFLRFRDMVRVSPDLIRLRADRNVYDTVSRYVRDPHLREALSFHSLLVGGNPFETSAIYTLIHYLERNWGVHFPKGGTGALIQSLTKLFEDLGGTIRLDTPVNEIVLTSRNGQSLHQIVCNDGPTDAYSAVVSNADIHHTYAHLYRGEASAQATKRQLERSQWSMSLFVLYFGTDRPYDIAHHTVLFGPRYKALLKDIFHGAVLPDDFSLYLHAPCVTDPSLAPEGCGSFYVLSPVPHLGNAPLDWEHIAPDYADRILGYLEGTMPDLRMHVVTRRWMTPLDFKHSLNAYEGAAFSLAPNLTQSAWFRPHNRDPKIPGLYIVGAGTHPGAGVPGVVNSAKATTRLVLADLGIGVS
jgi:phytoene desaturase